MVADCGLVLQSLIQKVSCGPVEHLYQFFLQFCGSQKGGGQLHWVPMGVRPPTGICTPPSMMVVITHCLLCCRRSLDLYTTPYWVEGPGNEYRTISTAHPAIHLYKSHPAQPPLGNTVSPPPLGSSRILSLENNAVQPFEGVTPMWLLLFSINLAQKAWPLFGVAFTSSRFADCSQARRWVSGLYLGKLWASGDLAF